MPEIFVRWLAIAAGELVREHLCPDAVDAKRIVAASRQSAEIMAPMEQDTTKGRAALRVQDPARLTHLLATAAVRASSGHSGSDSAPTVADGLKTISAPLRPNICAKH